MLKGLFGALMKLTDPRPRYTGERCLVERQSVGGCDRCMQVCPHDAVTITDHVEISDERCTGCGLCVQVCPSGALEYDLVGSLRVLKDQGVAAAGTPEPIPASLKCSKVPGDGPTVECLARVSPAELLASAAWGQNLTLARADCATCRLGGPEVPASIEGVMQIAAEYRKHLPGPAVGLKVVQYGAGSGAVEGDMVEASPLEVAPPTPPPPVSRRDAMGAFFGSARRSTAQLIPDRPLPGVSAKLEAARIPDEWVWRRKALRPKAPDDAPQYWPAPVVNERCIMCPVCQNVCPTAAITRTTDEVGHMSLYLELEACTGCNACVVSCPPDAMTLEAFTPTSSLGETVLLHEAESF